MLHKARKQFCENMQIAVCMRFIRCFSFDNSFKSREEYSVRKIVQAIRHHIRRRKKDKIISSHIHHRSNEAHLFTKLQSAFSIEYPHITTGQSRSRFVAQNPIEVSLLARTRPRNSLEQIVLDLSLDLLPKMKMLPAPDFL